MSHTYKELLQITSQAFAAFLLVLLADAFVVAVAFMLLLGDHTDSVPEYNYSREIGFAVSILSVYSVVVLLAAHPPTHCALCGDYIGCIPHYYFDALLVHKSLVI